MSGSYYLDLFSSPEIKIEYPFGISAIGVWFMVTRGEGREELCFFFIYLTLELWGVPIKTQRIDLTELLSY